MGQEQCSVGHRVSVAGAAVVTAVDENNNVVAVANAVVVPATAAASASFAAISIAIATEAKFQVVPNSLAPSAIQHSTAICHQM